MTELREFEVEPGVFETETTIDNGAFGARTIRFETGRLAKQASGSAVVYLDDETMMLSTTTAAKQPREGFDFFPLTVDVEERMYAAGRIPGNFFRREGRETLTYEGFGESVRGLAQIIAEDGYRPDIILAIARGGLFVAGGLGYALDVKNLHVMNVEYYTGINESLELPVMLPPVPKPGMLRGAKVLIADDVADTGATLRFVHDFVKDYVEDVRCAVIYQKPGSIVDCDYVWNRTDKWINFPWSTLPPIEIK